MRSARWSLLVVVGLSLAGLAVVLGHRAPDPSVPARVDHGPVVEPAEAPRAGGAVPTRREADVSPTAPDATARVVHVHGRCVHGADGAGFAGCEVGARLASGSAVAAAVTGADGRFSLHLHVPAVAREPAVELDVAADGCAPRSGRWSLEPETFEIDVGDVPMVRAIRVRGVVVDTADEPVPDADVMLVRVDLTGRRDVVPRATLQARTDRLGHFAFDAVASPGEWVFGVEGSGALVGPRVATLGDDRPEREFRVVVERPDAALAILGTVVDELGAPLADVSIEAIGEGFAGRGRSRADGGFVVHRGGPRNDDGRSGVALSARDGAGAFEPIDPGARVAWGARDVTVVMRRLATVDLRAIDARGRPVDGYLAVVLRDVGGAWSRVTRATQRVRDPDGRARLTGLRAGRHGLLVVPADDRMGPTSIVGFDVGDAAPRELVVDVPDRGSWTVEVVTRAGAAVADSLVELLMSIVAEAPTVASPAVPADAADGGRGAPAHLVVATARTDAAGRATLAVSPGARWLRVSGATHVAVVEPVDGTASSVRVVVDAGAVLRGRVGPPDALARLATLAGSVDGPCSIRLTTRPDGVTYDGVVADDGAFTIPALPAGTHDVALRYALRTGDVQEGVVDEPLGTVVLVDGAATGLDVDLAARLPGTLRGRVVVDGAPLAQTHVFVRREPDGGKVTSFRVATDGDGRFTGLVPPGRYGLAITLPSQPGPGWIYLAVPETRSLAADGERTFDVAVTLRTARIALVGPDGAPLAGRPVRVARDGRYFLPGRLETDARGVVEETAPAPLTPFGLDVDSGGTTVRVGPIDPTAAAGASPLVVRVGG